MHDATAGGGASPAPLPASSRGARVVLAEAPWCGECRRMAPLVAEVAAAHPDVHLERLDVSVDGDRARELRVMATPTLIGFTGDAEVARIAGRQGREGIDGFFEALASGSQPPRRTSATDATVRVVAGAALVAVGVVSGPAWPLVAIGIAVAGYGLGGFLPRRSP